MKTPVAMLARKTTLILLVLLVALALWVVQQRSLARTRLAVAEAETRRVKLQERVTEATAARESVRRELRAQQSKRTEVLAALAKEEEELARVDPEVRWVAPPTELPEWNADSPYVWLRKEMLPKLSVSAFTDNGELRGEVATVLTLTDSQRLALNASLPRLLSEYRALEVAHAERLDESAAGPGNKDRKVTVRIKPMPEEGGRLKQQFEAALRSQQGEQRASLLMQLSEVWLNNHFNRFGTKPKTISVIRHPNNTYDISDQSSSGSSFVGSTVNFDEYIPAHLLPLFGDVLNPAVIANPSVPPQ